MKTNRIITRCSLLVLGGMVCSMVGCSAGADSRHAGDIGAIRSNPSPAMHSLSQRETDRYNDYAVSNDTNLRMIHNDIDKHLLFLDRPSRLSKYPTKH